MTIKRDICEFLPAMRMAELARCVGKMEVTHDVVGIELGATAYYAVDRALARVYPGEENEISFLGYMVVPSEDPDLDSVHSDIRVEAKVETAVEEKNEVYYEQEVN